ncbi:unnamed protein product [Alopecurus aequalis]
MESNIIIHGARDDAGSSLYVNRINSFPDHLRLHYILSLNGLRVFAFHDRISLLPDDLLHRILSFLSTQDAIRTSVLSRRWQRVWIDLPTFMFSDDKRTAAGFATSVDEVLAHSHGMDKLEISIRHPSHFARANEWLQHASDRVREKISIIFRYDAENTVAGHDCDPVVLDLPCGGRTTAMAFHSRPTGVVALVIPHASAAVPSSLTQLELKYLRIDVNSLSIFVSSCCPRLRKLVVHSFGDEGVLRLSNDALEDLDLDFYYGGLRRLEVSSCNLRHLRISEIFSPEVMAHEVHDGTKAASFRTPRLEVLSWTPSTSIHPSRVEFAHSLATVRQLDVGLATHFMVNRTRLHYNKLAVWLLQRCTGVRRLKVSLGNLHPSPIFVSGVLDEASLSQYQDLMVEVPQLTTVTDLTVCTLLDHHAYGASIAKLLSRCSHVETLAVIVRDKYEHRYICARTSACWCKCPADWREEKLRLEFLRQVDLKGFITADWLPDLVSLLRYSRPPAIITAHNIHERYELSDASTLQILQHQKRRMLVAY